MKCIIIPIFEVRTGDNFPIILNSDFIFNNGEPLPVERFHKNSDEFVKTIEKTIDKYDETLAVFLSGFVIKYTLIFNEIEPSSYGKGSIAFNTFLNHTAELCYNTTGNAYFRKCKKIFTKEIFLTNAKSFY